MPEVLKMSFMLLVLGTFHTLRLGDSLTVHTVRQKRAVFDILPTMSSDYEILGINQPENKWNSVPLKYKSKIQFLRRMVRHLHNVSLYIPIYPHISPEYPHIS